MQTARKVKNDFSNDLVNIKLTTITQSEDKALNDNDRKKPCFQTDERYFCKDANCAFSSECKKLIAAWMR